MGIELTQILRNITLIIAMSFISRFTFTYDGILIHSPLKDIGPHRELHPQTALNHITPNMLAETILQKDSR